MGNLLDARLRPERLFAYSGVDYDGPFLIKQELLRKSDIIKSYITLFICLVTKTVRLDLVTDLDTIT